MICIVVCVLFKVTVFTLCTCVMWFVTNIVYITYSIIFRYWCVTVWSLETFVIMVFSSHVKDVAPFKVLTDSGRCGVVCCSWCDKCCWFIFTFSDWCCSR